MILTIESFICEWLKPDDFKGSLLSLSATFGSWGHLQSWAALEKLVMVLVLPDW